GAGLVAWQSTPLPLPGSTGNGLTHIHARRFAAASGTFGRKFTLTPDGDSVRLGESRTGKIAAIWQQSTPPWPIRARFGPCNITPQDIRPRCLRSAPGADLGRIGYHSGCDCRVGLAPCTERIPGHCLITARARGPPPLRGARTATRNGGRGYP